jgi:hypothetical protein
VLIGDSDFDMPAAENAGALSIGFVDEPWKAQTLGEAGPNALVGTMSQLAAAIADAGQSAGLRLGAALSSPMRRLTFLSQDMGCGGFGDLWR